METRDEQTPIYELFGGFFGYSYETLRIIASHLLEGQTRVPYPANLEICGLPAGHFTTGEGRPFLVGWSVSKRD